MKITKLFALMLVVVLVLMGCGQTTPNDNGDDLPADTEEQDLVVAEIHDWLKTMLPKVVNENVVLPTTHPELGGRITWTSYTPGVINDGGVLLATQGVHEVMMGYEISFEGASVNVSEIFEFRVVATSFDVAAQKFADQFSNFITRDYTVNTGSTEGYKIKWYSSNENIFSNDGKYTQPDQDTKITLHYEVSFGEETRTYTKEVTVLSKTVREKMNDVSEWIRQNYLPNRLITSEVVLPARFEPYDARITWRSSDVGVIGVDGSVKRFAFDRYISLESTIEIEGMIQIMSYSHVVAKKEFPTKEAKIASFLEAIAVSDLDRLAFAAYGNINQSYNFLPFYTNSEAPIIQQIIKKNGEDGFKGSRPGTKLGKVEYITIHDTANNNANAKGHANLLSGGFSASWHFAVDDTVAYQSIPLDEVAWHAGDGGQVFTLVNTGVVATSRYPVITINAAGKYVLNGTESSVIAPTLGTSGRIPQTSDIASAGIYTEIRDGVYYMSGTYYNKDYGKISNMGGNQNSIGFETCVNSGTDYATVLRITAKIVGGLLIDNHLSVDRVLQHNNFSGKECPNAIRHINYWSNFLDLVAMERFAQEEFADVSFVWSSQTPILQDNGRISLTIGSTKTVMYSVNVSYGETSFSKSFSTRLVG